MQQNTAALLVLALLITTAWAAAACSQARPAPQEPGQELSTRLPLPAKSLPPFPMERGMSLAMDFVTEGEAYWDKSAGASVFNGGLDLIPSPGSFDWGIWQLNPGDGELLAVEASIMFQQSSEVFIGLADFESTTWELFGPFSNSQKIPMEDTRHRSPGGFAYIAVIVSGNNSARVDRLILTTDRHGWQIVEVNSSGQMNYLTSLVSAGGNPAISWFRTDTNHLMYARSTTPFGAQPQDWPEPVVIDLAEAGGSYHSLAIVEGNPALSYYQHSEQNLKYAWSSTPTGMQADDWKPFTTVATAGIVGQHNSLAVVDGNPAICFANTSEKSLMYVRSNTATGSGEGVWTDPVTVDTGSVGWYSSLGVVDGNPAIAYYDYLNDDLRYARSSTTTGDSPLDWSSVIVVDGSGSTGQFASLAIVAGNPAISYFESLPKYDLMYTRSTSPTGSLLIDWAPPIAVDQEGNVGQGASLTTINGLPAISYTDRFNQTLKFTQSDSPTGDESDDWHFIETVDSIHLVGWYTSLAEINGFPAISYVHTNGDGKGISVIYAVFVD